MDAYDDITSTVPHGDKAFAACTTFANGSSSTYTTVGGFCVSVSCRVNANKAGGTHMLSVLWTVQDVVVFILVHTTAVSDQLSTHYTRNPEEKQFVYYKEQQDHE